MNTEEIEMDQPRSNRPPKERDVVERQDKVSQDTETEASTGALKPPQMPPILDRKGSPDIDKRR
jgi:septal ring-binding cell division protein DamX